LWKRRQKREENVENGWKTRQKRQTDTTHNRIIRVLWKKLQASLRQKENLNNNSFTLSYFFHPTKAKALGAQSN